MRIISGKYRHRRFTPPNNFRARPTTDFAKENLFNVLQNMIDFEDIKALDLFGGTGSISFELLSRGAKNVTCVEQNRNHAAFIKEISKTLKCEDDLRLIIGDVFRFIKTTPSKQFDFIFADPPYDLPKLEEIPQIILERQLLNEDGLLIFEHSKEYDFSKFQGFFQLRKYGAVHFSFFKLQDQQ